METKPQSEREDERGLESGEKRWTSWTCTFSMGLSLTYKYLYLVQRFLGVVTNKVFPWIPTFKSSMTLPKASFSSLTFSSLRTGRWSFGLKRQHGLSPKMCLVLTLEIHPDVGYGSRLEHSVHEHGTSCQNTSFLQLFMPFNTPHREWEESTGNPNTPQYSFMYKTHFLNLTDLLLVGGR